MWSRCSSSSVWRRSFTAVLRGNPTPPPVAPPLPRFNPFRDCHSCSPALWRVISDSTSKPFPSHGFSSSAGSDGGGGDVSSAEAKKLMKQVDVGALKMKLGMEGKDVVGYQEFLATCRTMGASKTLDEAIALTGVLDEAGVILIFRDMVFLHPVKVVDLVRRAVPLALTPENDPRRVELKKLREKKEEIDALAHKQVRRILFSGLALVVAQVSLYFRLTFWEFSWDIMEPITFFTTGTAVVVGYSYFLFTSRDPSYEDFMKTLFLSRQRKLFTKHNFNVERFRELQRKLKNPGDAAASIKNRQGLVLRLDV